MLDISWKAVELLFHILQTLFSTDYKIVEASCSDLKMELNHI